MCNSNVDLLWKTNIRFDNSSSAFFDVKSTTRANCRFGCALISILLLCICDSFYLNCSATGSCELSSSGRRTASRRGRAPGARQTQLQYAPCRRDGGGPCSVEGRADGSRDAEKVRELTIFSLIAICLRAILFMILCLRAILSLMYAFMPSRNKIFFAQGLKIMKQ